MATKEGKLSEYYRAKLPVTIKEQDAIRWLLNGLKEARVHLARGWTRAQWRDWAARARKFVKLREADGALPY